MIAKDVKLYCKNYNEIENYEQAVLDNTQVWECHHKKEIEECKTSDQLKQEGLYYNRLPEELIFLTENEHHSIHKHSEETKRKISKVMKGRISPKKGIPLSEEHKRKISEAKTGEKNSMYGKHFTEEQRRKISEAVANHWAKKRTLSKYIQ